MSEALKLQSGRNKVEDVEQSFLSSLEDVADIVNALAPHCATVEELAETVNAARVVPGVLRMVLEKVKDTPKR